MLWYYIQYYKKALKGHIQSCHVETQKLGGRQTFQVKSNQNYGNGAVHQSNTIRMHYSKQY